MTQLRLKFPASEGHGFCVIDLPLHGVRVLDFGQYIAGPLAAKLLAEQGAEVIRIEMPDGPRGSRQTYELLNRRKKSIVLDLKTRTDRRIAHDLMARSDVVIENFRPGIMGPSFNSDPELRTAMAA